LSERLPPRDADMSTLPPNENSPLQMVVAVARNGTIGDRDALPWRLSSDLQRFKRLTMGHALLMGRKTYESIGRLLPGRQTIILSRSSSYRVPGAFTATTIDDALALIPSGIIPFVVGGAEIYRHCWPRVGHLHITHVMADVSGDTQLAPLALEGFTRIEQEYVPSDEKNDWPSTYEHWVKR